MKIVRYFLLVLLVAVLIAAAVVAFFAYQWTNAPLPQVEGTLTIAGLKDRVEVIRDTWGVPHIYASNLHDLFFAQGYVQAQDRWWQMEFNRHIGSGSIQELTGENKSVMGQDIFIRTVGWRRSAERDLELLDPEIKGYIQSFSDGVNAYIQSRPVSQLAFEYNLLGVTGVNIPIEPWTPVDSVVWTKVMAWDLSGNMSDEEFSSAFLEEFDAELLQDYEPGYPFDTYPTIIQPDELPAAGEPFAVTNTFTDGITGINSNFAGNFDTNTGFAFGKGADIGSNNWVTAGSMTESGNALLANDPHLSIGMPSIWYQIGLHCQPVSAECPLNLRGLGFSVTPGIVVGHNDHIAWGVTNTTWDTQDLYRIKINPDNPLQYEWNGDWRDMTVHEEVIRYGDSDETVTLQVRETHLGPIINDNQRDDDGKILGFNNDNPLALRWTALDEGGTLFTALMRLNQATNWEEFRAAVALWDTPSQNVVYADTEGNIGYQIPGKIPVRAPGHDGLLPMDGSTDEFEWRGYVPFEYLPSLYNPERGYISTANQALVPLEYYASLAQALGTEFGEDAHYVFGYQWDYGQRGARINELLEATEKHTIESFSAIHGDNKSLFAERIAPYLADIDFEDAALNDLRDWMLEWDFHMNAESSQGALFGMFWFKLGEYLYEDELAAIDEQTGYGGEVQWATGLLMAEPENVWWDDASTADVVETRDAIVRRAFTAAYDEIVKKLGEKRDDWSWGALHTATFISNPLGVSGIDLIENMVNRGPVPTGGGSAIVNATAAFNTSLEVRAAPSMRLIVDMGDFSNSQIIHTTGQSGHPFSSHYGNMIDLWRKIEYIPMLWTRDQVDANTASTLILNP